MVSGKSKAAIEFLHFLADISDPVTGSISCMTLAAWFGMTGQELQKRWIRRGANVAWQTFADELLAVLDAAQAQGRGLEQVIDWYFHTPIAQAGLRTADQLVIAGEARWLTRQLDTCGISIPAPRRKRVPLSR
jgi:NAD-dependent oxidoreductase involved in siderophore biosynthesis